MYRELANLIQKPEDVLDVLRAIEAIAYDAIFTTQTPTDSKTITKWRIIGHKLCEVQTSIRSKLTTLEPSTPTQDAVRPPSRGPANRLKRQPFSSRGKDLTFSPTRAKLCQKGGPA